MPRPSDLVRIFAKLDPDFDLIGYLQDRQDDDMPYLTAEELIGLMGDILDRCERDKNA